MDYRQTLIKMIDKFNVTAVEEFKEAELKIYADSKSVFKKRKDYDGHLQKLRRCKKEAQKIDPRSVKIPEDDKQTQELMDHFQKCLIIFSGICDAYIQFVTSLKNKAEGTENIKYSELKHISNKMREGKTNLNEHLTEMNIRYAEFNDLERGEEDKEDLKDVNYFTYEDLKGSDE